MRTVCIGLVLGVLLLPAFSFGENPDTSLAGFEGFTPKKDETKWSPVLTTGFDALLHSYPLATTDTTETIAEYMVSAGVEGRSPRKVHHRWRLRAEASAGSELYRQLVEGQYKYLDKNRVSRLRLDGRFYGRQYRQTTDYSLSSNNLEGRIDLRAYPWAGSKSTLELRGWKSILDYKNPSTLEVDTRELGAGVFLRNSGFTENPWSVGYRLSGRTYPDTTGIDRKVHRIEGDLDYHDDQGQGIRLFHKSGRRLIRDETVRPSAWAHYTDLNSLVTAGAGFVFMDLQSEIWKYDEETTTYFNSWRIEGAMGYRWGDLMKATWRLGLTGERLDAGDSPETYTQFGLRAGVESFVSVVSGSVQLEYGRRVYSQADVELDSSTSDDLLADDLTSFYSDFNYWKIWLMANWYINEHFSLDLMANYEPESHTESGDDSSIGFGSVRLVWRP
jgi:hypothetical protein